ncbi:anti-phage deoxyguanosine triphosphatase [Rhizorhabdus wittichii]|uniref:anti-phage deoxyguanosine triphosphatase n=1 Tax=Rhizorhabdus wittichii TaxID=160791 RepID=UPI00055B5092|nr:anti-phage deoxyguanosine triphosphatase [Rhizorhabdus wittichii]
MTADTGAEIWGERREGWIPGKSDARNAAATDYGRIVHSSSFRRLQGKTQILNLGDSDFYRNRLTHSIEVAQVAGGIVLQLQKDFPDHAAAPWIPDPVMVQAIGATHDLGHPPFGHGGEIALHYGMRNHGGFEGNGQTLRILSRLEKFSESNGANLSRRSLLGVLKYPAPMSAVRSVEKTLTPALIEGTSVVHLINRKACRPPKCYLDTETDVVDWLLDPLPHADRDLFTAWKAVEGDHGETMHKSFDCSIMDLADDIAFGVHDLEDALTMGLMDAADLECTISEDSCTSFLEYIQTRENFGNDVHGGLIKALSNDATRKRNIGRMVTHLITSVRITAEESFETPLLRYRVSLPEAQRTFLRTLKKAVKEKVIRSARVQQLEFKGQNMVVAVFEAFATDPKSLLPESTRARYEAADDKMRVICDHVSGMTDNFLMRTYERLFSPRMGSVFDRI